MNILETRKYIFIKVTNRTTRNGEKKEKDKEMSIHYPFGNSLFNWNWIFFAESTVNKDTS